SCPNLSSPILLATIPLSPSNAVIYAKFAGAPPNCFPCGSTSHNNSPNPTTVNTDFSPALMVSNRPSFASAPRFSVPFPHLPRVPNRDTPGKASDAKSHCPDPSQSLAAATAPPMPARPFSPTPSPSTHTGPSPSHPAKSTAAATSPPHQISALANTHQLICNTTPHVPDSTPAPAETRSSPPEFSIDTNKVRLTKNAPAAASHRALQPSSRTPPPPAQNPAATTSAP